MEPTLKQRIIERKIVAAEEANEDAKLWIGFYKKEYESEKDEQKRANITLKINNMEDVIALNNRFIAHCLSEK